MLKLDPKNTELLNQKQTVLNETIKTTQDKLEELQKAKAEYDKKMAEGTEVNQENYRYLQREIIKTEENLKKLQLESSKWTQTGEKLIQWGENLDKISSKLDNLGNKLTTRLTVPIAALYAGSIKGATEFESAFKGVEKTVDGTAEQMENLKKGIKDLATQIPSTTTEISAVAEAAGQLGIQTDNVLSFTKTMIDMGNATNLTADEAATTLARFANVTKMKQSDFDRLGSVIVELGNNFATTEAEIASMGMNLASAGTQVGMSQSQIMALATALSSVGLEAQAGGTAFSKVMVNMQLAVEKGGKDLKKFASVAGMSTKEFKKAFQEDASSAIMKFVEGLSQSGERGKSAIKVLDDMGITETRLRDALLRSANASSVMNEAIKLGNKAWNENTALTNEATKRYETTESKIAMTKNKINNLAMSLGDKLLPSVNKILDKTDKWITKLDKLSDSEKENIVKIGLMVAAAGPLLKIGSSAISIVSGTAKGIGTLSQAIGVMKTGTESANQAANGLAKGLNGIISPAGAAAAGVALYAAAVAATKANVDKEFESLKKLNEELENNNNARKNSIEAIDKQRDESIAEINNTEQLRKELELLVDENGKVKEGYESRAKFILGELNNALGTEYSMTDNVINKYKNLIDTIDEVILKKKAQIILEANEEGYKDAIKNKDQLYKDYIKTLDELKDKQKRFNELQEEANRGFIGSNQSLVYNALEMKELSEEITKLSNNLTNETTTLERYSLEINNYQKNSELMLQGGVENYKKIEESVSTTQQNITKLANVGLNERLKAQIEANEQSKKEYALEAKYNEDAKNSIYATNVKKGQENLKLLADELIARTSTIGELGEDEKEAWKTLGENSYDEYDKAISQMPVAMKNKIIEMTGIASKDTSVEEAAKHLAKEAEDGFNNNVNGKEWGTDLSKELSTGMTSQKSKSWIENAADTVAGWISSFLHFSVPDKGPLSDMDKSMPDMIDLMSKGIKSNSYKLVNSAQILAKDLNNVLGINSIGSNGIYSNGLNKKVMSDSKTIFTTPQIVFNVQELDEAKLQQCFNYVNKKFGSQY